jgi:hypothetical protein
MGRDYKGNRGGKVKSICGKRVRERECAKANRGGKENKRAKKDARRAGW